MAENYRRPRGGGSGVIAKSVIYEQFEDYLEENDDEKVVYLPPFVSENNFSKDKQNLQPLEIDFDRKFPNRLVKNHFFLGKTNFWKIK